MSVFDNSRELETTLQILDELADDTKAHCSAWEFQVLGLISDLQRVLAQAVVAESRAHRVHSREQGQIAGRPTSKTELHKTLLDQCATEGYLLMKWSTLKRIIGNTSEYRELKRYVRERNL